MLMKRTVLIMLVAIGVDLRTTTGAVAPVNRPGTPWTVSTPTSGSTRNTNNNVAGDGAGPAGGRATFRFGIRSASPTILADPATGMGVHWVLIPENEVGVTVSTMMGGMPGMQAFWGQVTLTPPAMTGWSVSPSGPMPGMLVYVGNHDAGIVTAVAPPGGGPLYDQVECTTNDHKILPVTP